MSNVIHPTNENFDNTIAEGIVMVDFMAQWCAPCRIIAPIVEELADQFEGKVKICKIDTDKEQELAVKFGIRSIPTILFFKDGQMVDQLSGAGDKTVFVDKINSLL